MSLFKSLLPLLWTSWTITHKLQSIGQTSLVNRYDNMKYEETLLYNILLGKRILIKTARFSENLHHNSVGVTSQFPNDIHSLDNR